MRKLRLRKAVSFLVHTKKGHYVLIGLFALLAHGLLLLNDGVYWDGWLIYVAKITNRWELTSGIYADRGGLPLYTAFHWLLYQIPPFIFGYKLAAFVFISASAFFIYRIARLLFVNPLISLFISLLALTYPANQATVELIVIPYLLSYFLFWLGCLLLVLALANKKRNAIWLHLSAVFSLVPSFRMYSLLVYFYGFLFILFLVYLTREEKAGFFQKAKQFVFSHFMYLVLPVGFWLGNAWLFPPSGFYVDADAFIWGPVLFELTGNYLLFGVAGQLLESLANLANPLVLLLVAAIGWLAVWGFANKKRTQPWSGATLSPSQLVFAGAVLFAAGVIPYVIVGRSTMLHGWATRNAILIAVPIAIFLVGLAWGLGARAKKKQAQRVSKITVFVFFALTILFTLETANFYLFWQLRTIKDYSVIAHIARQAETLEDTSVLYVHDTFRVGGENRYRPHEYFGMLAAAIPGSEKIGFDVNYYTYEEYFLTSNESIVSLFELWYPHLDIHGCQAEMYIDAGTARLDPTIFLKYFYYKYLNSSRLGPFLLTVTSVDIIPIESALATNCHR